MRPGNVCIYPILSAVTGADTKWTHQGAGQRYAASRFRTARARERDLRLVSRLLARHRATPERVLDVPAGTGRLRANFADSRRYVAVDRSPSMLAQCEGNRLQADILALPFPDDCFDLVLCCRLLHHLDPSERRACLRELARVSRGWVIVSFWDSASYHAWRRRLGLRRARHADPRRSASRADLERDCAAAGLEVLGYAASMRWISPQTFLAARVDGS